MHKFGPSAFKLAGSNDGYSQYGVIGLGNAAQPARTDDLYAPALHQALVASLVSVERLPEVRFLDLVSLTDVSLQQAADLIAVRDPGAPFAFIVTPNAAHMTILAKPENPLFAPYEAAWLRLCDGQAIRLLGRALFKQRFQLVAGSDLTVLLLRTVLQPDDEVMVVGGDEQLAAALQAQFGLRRLTLYRPPMGFIGDPAAVARCIEAVLAHPARLLFVITGSPQSEQLLLQISQTGRATGVGVSVGSSLHFATGLIPRAPLLMRHLAMEWLFRLARSPRRHAKRVFVDSLPVVTLALRVWLRNRARG